MRLRVPGSGSFIETLFTSHGLPPSADDAIEAPTIAQLDEAIAALSRGEIEYVILENEDDFLQIADAGDGRVIVQVSQQDEMQEIAGGTTVAEAMPIVAAYLRGDPGWRAAAWVPMA